MQFGPYFVHFSTSEFTQKLNEGRRHISKYNIYYPIPVSIELCTKLTAFSLILLNKKVILMFNFRFGYFRFRKGYHKSPTGAGNVFFYIK